MEPNTTISPQPNNIIPSSITEEMQKSYLDYAMSVIVSRALPDARDGLKPVQRRIIYAMLETGMTHESRYQKCAAVIGEVLKKYHPHGDTSVYDALARMAQNFSLRYPLVDGQGNFGSVDGDPPAAMRYTECRLSKIASEVTCDMEKETVEYTLNYSGDYKEPVLLPSKIPNLLLNGATGIAVGMATNIPPHNLGELVDGLLLLIENADNPSFDSFSSKSVLADLLGVIKGPDFPTGGIIYNHKDIAQTYETGRGRIVARAKCEIEEEKGGRYSIIVTEIPYMVNKSELLEHIADLVKDKRVEGISDLRDESDKDGMRVAIELKKDANPQRILNLLYKHSDLQKAFNSNMVALINNEPKLMNLKTLLEEFVKHRVLVTVRKTNFLLKKARDREHILLGLKIAIDHIDEVIQTIKASKDTPTAQANLIKKFAFTEIQATAILEMQLRRLAALERQKIEDELKTIKDEITRLLLILSSPINVLSEVKKELVDVKERYADKRKTKVVRGTVDEPDDEDLIEKEDVVVTLTKTGYIKRLSLDSFKKQGRGGKGVKGSELKEDDILDKILISNTHDNLFAFTNKGRVYSVRVWDLPEASRNAKGTAIVNLLSLGAQEKVTALINVSNTPPPAIASRSGVAGGQIAPLFLTMLTRKGVIKKTTLDEFSNIRNSGILAIKIGEGDSLDWVHLTNGNCEIILTTENGMSIRFPEKDARPMGRAAGGVTAIRLKGQDVVVGSAVLDEKKPGEKTSPKLMVISQKGMGKRTPMEEYRSQSRAGSGVLTYKTTEKTGKLVGAKLIEEENCDVLITATNGQVIRLAISEIPTLGRNTQGVHLIRLTPPTIVASFTLIMKEEE